MNTWKDLSLFVVSEMYPSYFNRVIESLQRSQTAIYVRNSNESRNSVNIVPKSNVGRNCISACAILGRITGWGKCQRPPPLESIENYNGRPQWCIRLVFVYDVYFHDCESHDSFTIPVFPLWGKVHGRLSAITNANSLYYKNSKKLKKH